MHLIESSSSYVSNVYYRKDYDQFNLGVGGDLALKFDLSESVAVRLGTSINFDVSSYWFVSANYSISPTSEWAKSYSALTFLPFISIGLNFADVAQKSPRQVSGDPQ